MRSIEPSLSPQLIVHNAPIQRGLSAASILPDSSSLVALLRPVVEFYLIKNIECDVSYPNKISEHPDSNGFEIGNKVFPVAFDCLKLNVEIMFIDHNYSRIRSTARILFSFLKEIHWSFQQRIYNQLVSCIFFSFSHTKSLRCDAKSPSPQDAYANARKTCSISRVVYNSSSTCSITSCSEHPD